MRKRILVLTLMSCLVISFPAPADTASPVSGALLISDQIATALTFELAGAGVAAGGGMLSGLLFYPVAGLILHAEGVSGEQYFAGAAYYPLLASSILLNPIYASIGVSAVGRDAGLAGSWRVPVYAYLATVPGVATLIAGYPRVAIPLLWVGPAIGATVGFHRDTRQVEDEWGREFSEFHIALRIWSGSMLGGFAYLSARLVAPYVLEDPPIPALDLVAHMLEAGVWDYALVIPAVTSYGAVYGARTAGKSASWLFTGTGGLLGSAIGWFVGTLLPEKVNAPAVMYSMIGSTAGAYISTRIR